MVGGLDRRELVLGLAAGVTAAFLPSSVLANDSFSDKDIREYKAVVNYWSAQRREARLDTVEWDKWESLVLKKRLKTVHDAHRKSALKKLLNNGRLDGLDNVLLAIDADLADKKHGFEGLVREWLSNTDNVYSLYQGALGSDNDSPGPYRVGFVQFEGKNYSLTGLDFSPTIHDLSSTSSNTPVLTFWGRDNGRRTPSLMILNGVEPDNILYVDAGFYDSSGKNRLSGKHSYDPSTNFVVVNGLLKPNKRYRLKGEAIVRVDDVDQATKSRYCRKITPEDLKGRVLHYRQNGIYVPMHSEMIQKELKADNLVLLERFSVGSVHKESI